MRKLIRRISRRNQHYVDMNGFKVAYEKVGEK